MRPPAPDWSALAGTRILDLSRLLPDPFADPFADLGADVVTVEQPGAGRTDPTRLDRTAYA